MRATVRECSLLIACLATTAAGVGEAADPAARWPQFRGEDAAGISREARAPATWSATDHVAWTVEIPGRGWSSPVVWGDTVFVTSAISPGPFKRRLITRRIALSMAPLPCGRPRRLSRL